MKQVNKSHYDFSEYTDKRRWASIWHQVDELCKLSPDKVLEIGPGPGTLKYIMQSFGIKVQTVDLDPELFPDYVASATQLPMQKCSFDVVCAFQVLEHLPFESSILAFSEMVRVASKFVLISLPDETKLWSYSYHLPKQGNRTFHIRKPLDFAKPATFDGQHYWELNKIGFETETVLSQLLSVSPQIRKVRNFRVTENTYHHFFLFEKI